MELSKILLVVVIVVVALVLILFPEARALLKGFTRLFIKDMAQTPDGAEAIYTEKIDQVQDSYSRAENALRIASGKLSNAKRDLAAKKERLKKVETDCENLVKAGKIKEAEIKSDEREEIVADIERLNGLIQVYQKAEVTAQEAFDMCEKNLRKLKREKNDVVENMRVKTEMQKVYDDLDDLKAVTGVDKALGYVRDKNKDLDAAVEGARVVHNNKMSTKIQRAEAEARKANSSDYLESLKKKYNK